MADFMDFMNYKSPLQMAVEQVVTEMRTNAENELICGLKQNYAIDVNKEELIKALNYDREQYKAGYRDGYIEAKKQAFWEMTEYGYFKCSRCGGEMVRNDYPHCCWCGAKMFKQTEDDNG